MKMRAYLLLHKNVIGNLWRLNPNFILPIIDWGHLDETFAMTSENSSLAMSLLSLAIEAYLVVNERPFLGLSTFKLFSQDYHQKN